MDNKTLFQLANYAAKGIAPAGYEVDTVNSALADGLRELLNDGDIYTFAENKYTFFRIITQNAAEVVPARLTNLLGTFAEVVRIGQGEKASFKVSSKLRNRNRAKRFITRVGLAGVYESFRLDNDRYDVSTDAIGGAISVDYERLLDGADTLADLMEAVTDGLAEKVTVEIHKALKSAIGNASVPANNQVVQAGFEPNKMVSLINTVKAYGNSAVIFAPPEFIGAMGADAIIPIASGVQGVYHPDDIDAIHKTGYIKIFRGAPVVEIPQSFVDEKNDKVWIDPQTAYVLPSGGDKIVKIVLEGDLHVRDDENRDWSTEINFYQKMGIGILTYHNWGIYQNTEIDNANYFEEASGLGFY